MGEGREVRLMIALVDCEVLGGISDIGAGVDFDLDYIW